MLVFLKIAASFLASAIPRSGEQIRRQPKTRFVTLLPLKQPCHASENGADIAHSVSGLFCRVPMMYPLVINSAVVRCLFHVLAVSIALGGAASASADQN